MQAKAFKPKVEPAQTVRELNAAHALLDNEPRAATVEAMSGMLASTYVLYHKTLFYHWNVTGPHFASLHKLFEAQYIELQVAGDDIAERIRALGYFTPGTQGQFIALSSIEEDHVLPESDLLMVEKLMKANEMCSAEAAEVIAIAKKAEDEATMDLMIKRIGVHDKAAWMLRSYLG